MPTYLTTAQGASPSSPATQGYVDGTTVSSVSSYGSSMSGPLTLANQTADPAAPTNSVVLYSKAGALYTQDPDGNIETLQGSTLGLTANSTVANTAAETALLTYTVPANDAVAGAVYHLFGQGLYSWVSTPTIAFAARYGGTGGTSLATIPAVTLGTAQTSATFSVEGYLQFYSTTLAVATFTVMLSAATSTGLDAVYVGSTAVGSGTAVTSATQKTFVIDVTWGTAATGNTISAVTGYGERLA